LKYDGDIFFMDSEIHRTFVTVYSSNLMWERRQRPLFCCLFRGLHE